MSEFVISRKVMIKRKSFDFELYKSGEHPKFTWKIGASLTNGSPLRGLTFAEEAIYMPAIVGVSANSDKFSGATRKYWNNISTIVPEEGLSLETGWEWASKEDMEAEKDMAEENRRLGRPIVLSDYILWRYCLKYSRVANDKKDVNKSPKIYFYLYTKAEEIKEKETKLTVKRKARSLFYDMIHDRGKIKLVFISCYPTHDYSAYDAVEVDELLEQYIDKSVAKAEEFVKKATDEDLEVTALIHESLLKGKLTQQPNSEIIMFGSTVVGKTMNEAIGNLKSADPKFRAIDNNLRAELKYMGDRTEKPKAEEKTEKKAEVKKETEPKAKPEVKEKVEETA